MYIQISSDKSKIIFHTKHTKAGDMPSISQYKNNAKPMIEVNIIRCVITAFGIAVIID